MTAYRGFGRLLGGGLLAATVAVGACAPIRESRGFIIDSTLTRSIAAGVDNKQSVQATLGHPSFASEFGDPTWYYVSTVNQRRPFVRPRIASQNVLAVHFDDAGNVSSVEQSGIDKVVYLSPDGDETPTLGRERGFLQDLFGNIGTVGAPAANGAGGPTGP